MSSYFQRFFSLLILSYIATSWGTEPSPLEDKTKEELIIDLKDPLFQSGIVKTSKGGVIEGPGIRIQAQHIEYINRIEEGRVVKKILAEGDLLVFYKDRLFAGDKLVYDFTSNSGVMENGKTFIDLWYIGGKTLQLKEDGSFLIYDAYITTSANIDSTWEISSSKILVNKYKTVSANNIRFSFFKVPLFWWPSLKGNLQFLKDTPIKYKVTWDRKLGPKATMRYRVFSWHDLDAYFRLDYRLKKGPGLGLETEYRDPHKTTTFITRSYGAYDKVVMQEKNSRRFRFQGVYKTSTEDQKGLVYLTYDKLSDIKMVNDFKTDDFVINSEKRTRLLLSYQADDAFARLTFQPKINYFQSVNQELPRIIGGIRATELNDTGIISENRFNMGYLDYVFASTIQDYLGSLHSVRLETHNEIYRPFYLPGLSLVPRLGLIGIFYTTNPYHTSVGQALMHMGLNTRSSWQCNYSHFRHVIEPYANFDGYTRPRTPLNQHYIFDIDDGYHKLFTLKGGLKNQFFYSSFSRTRPSFENDSYIIAYFSDFTYKKTIPKAYTDFFWHRPTFSLGTGICYNIDEMVWDYVNLKGLVTVNAHLAFDTEFRHRSKFDWRKAAHHNFFLDVARPIPDLLNTPISDARDTLLIQCQARISPRTLCNLGMHNGWGRSSEPRYNGIKVEFTTLLTGNWRVKLGYQHSPNNDRFIFNIFLAQ